MSEGLQIENIEGVGPVTKQKLLEAGIHTMMDLLVRGPISVSDATGLDVDRASSICNKARTTLVKLGKLEKDFGHLKWADSAQQIHNRVRASYPWPAAFTFFRGKRVKVLETRVGTEGEGGKAPGTVLQISNDVSVRVQTGSGVIELHRVQAEGRREMAATEFAHGQRVQSGDHFE